MDHTRRTLRRGDLKDHLVLKMLLLAFSEIISLCRCMVHSSLMFSAEFTHRRLAAQTSQEKSFIKIFGRDLIYHAKICFTFR